MTQLQRLVIDPAQMTPPHLTLSREQLHYLRRVLRLQAGDRFLALNGTGQTWLAELGEAADAQLLEAIAPPTATTTALTLVAALPKGNSFDEVVRQATELGVSDILPVISERTLLKPSAQRCDRWRRIAQEAAEQSERAIVPTLHAPIPLATHFAALATQAGRKLMGTARQTAPHLATLALAPDQPLWIAIGPEGGWTEAEIAAAIAIGYEPISLGPRILRAVTAPVVALSLITAQLDTATPKPNAPTSPAPTSSGKESYS